MQNCIFQLSCRRKALNIFQVQQSLNSTKNVDSGLQRCIKNITSLIHFFSIYVVRPFRLPGVLMGDGRLGGTSGTISAYESTLKLGGYDIVAVVLEDHGLVNEVPLLSYLRNR